MNATSTATSPYVPLLGGPQYAALQAGFWLLVAGLMSIAILTDPPTTIMNEFDPTTRMIILNKLEIIKPSLWLGNVVLPLTGLFLTHVQHRVSTRLSWADLPLRRLVQYALASCLLLSGCGYVIVKTITCVSNRWWLKNDIQDGGFEYSLGDGSVPGFFVICTWMVIYYSLQAFTRLARMELMQLRQEAAIKDSRLDVIATQMNPHFLFNCLNTVRGLIEENPAGARDAVTHLAHVLRASLSSTRKRLVPLGEELETVYAHLMLESARHGSRLTLTSEADPAAATACIPPLLLQTLVENAVKHGVGTHPGPGFVHYSLRMDGGTLKITVRNSGNLAAGWDLPDKNGLGLIHTRERLALLYPGNASLSISEADGVVTVRADIPQQPSEPIPLS
ncbi:histidine kinase [Luteolibacter yonseiensis]|uniref:Histidine kinase n=1 Tax=Luteolibacter yonseiensis TaxID=1144680 RepID=A0A934R0Q4_9BACT|nr:histidine kinase [Luteolibacter yonseiensis]MBK1814018.1 histidine kinase [Luteolibacter yonseiensis]